MLKKLIPPSAPLEKFFATRSLPSGLIAPYWRRLTPFASVQPSPPPFSLTQEWNVSVPFVGLRSNCTIEPSPRAYTHLLLGDVTMPFSELRWVSTPHWLTELAFGVPFWLMQPKTPFFCVRPPVLESRLKMVTALDVSLAP